MDPKKTMGIVFGKLTCVRPISNCFYFSGFCVADFAQGFRGDGSEGFRDGVGVGEFCSGVGGGDGEDGDAGAVGGFDANEGVFDDEAICGRNAEALGGEEKNGGIGFSIFNLLAGDNDTEKIAQPHAVEGQIEVGAFG